jgi:hypothetical protein
MARLGQSIVCPHCKKSILHYNGPWFDPDTKEIIDWYYSCLNPQCTMYGGTLGTKQDEEDL